MSSTRIFLGTRASRPQSGVSGRDARVPRFSLSRSVLPATGTALRLLFRLPASTLLILIRAYQRFISPALPAFFGSTCGCRFAPSCSHYAAEAIRTHGAIAGAILAAIRLVKCTPLHPGGFDPVPPRRSPRCDRVPARA